ncbi:hypothetical protein ACI2J4_14095 [Agrobacterium tumefaciens]|uniref:Uncharacterized protein n=1 Tax=Agrobacterium tumefaciens TaxID=358 RepID=A0A176X494_AGRTU|nr:MULTISPECIES: hypothetical protein [Agrobacterium]OAE41968.1 hypothetical protein A7J57_02665 [Agrobacterium tumefaciens]
MVFEVKTGGFIPLAFYRRGLPQVELIRYLVCFMLRSCSNAYFLIVAVCETHARPSKMVDADKGKAGLCLRRKK